MIVFLTSNVNVIAVQFMPVTFKFALTYTPRGYIILVYISIKETEYE